MGRKRTGESPLEKSVGWPSFEAALKRPCGVDWFYRLAVAVGFRPKPGTRRPVQRSEQMAGPAVSGGPAVCGRDRRRKDPSPEEIRRACEQIRREWSAAERARRRRRRSLVEIPEWLQTADGEEDFSGEDM